MMTLGVGMPPQNVSMFLDTGSDITWLQCRPCTKCYKQYGPIFNPRNSSTFSPVGCGDSRCKQLQHHNFNGCSGKHNNTCLYKATYMDASFSTGTFINETLTLGNTTKLRNISLGCGHDNQGYWTADLAGVLGLGRGNLSFITQTKHQFKSQFSYCLAYWFSNTSKSSIVFGPSAVPTQTAAAYTPLIYTNITTSLYYVKLTGFSVNGTPVRGIQPSVFDLKSNGDGGVIFDSGTTYTQLVKKAYEPLRDAFRKAIQNQTNSNVSVGRPRSYESSLDTCYDISPEKFNDVDVPMVKLHFDQGANMTLRPDNTISLMYTKNETVDTFCFAFMSNDRYTTIGNIQQQTTKIVYDVSGSRVGFVPEAC